MLRCCIVLLLALSSGVARAQEFAVINDPDGYVYVRKEQNIKAEIMGKLYDGQIFYYERDRSGSTWWGVCCDLNQDINLHYDRAKRYTYDFVKGFVPSDRVVLISSMAHPELSNKNRKINAKDLAIDWGSRVRLVVKSRKFNKEKHKIIGDKNVPALTIDGKHPYGRDGEVPRSQISFIKLTIGQSIVDIPVKAFNDLYEPTLANWNIYRDKKGMYYIMSNNSDGAGGYDLVFVIKNGKFIGRYIGQP